jgi:hypothetical protein
MDLRRIQRGLIRACWKCRKETDTVVVDFRIGKAYCEACADVELRPLPHFVLTERDLVFFRSCGIDPQKQSIIALKPK